MYGTAHNTNIVRFIFLSFLFIMCVLFSFLFFCLSTLSDFTIRIQQRQQRRKGKHNKYIRVKSDRCVRCIFAIGNVNTLKSFVISFTQMLESIRWHCSLTNGNILYDSGRKRLMCWSIYIHRTAILEIVTVCIRIVLIRLRACVVFSESNWKNTTLQRCVECKSYRACIIIKFSWAGKQTHIALWVSCVDDSDLMRMMYGDNLVTKVTRNEREQESQQNSYWGNHKKTILA